MYNSKYFATKCPCRYIMAFNICRLNRYGSYTNLKFNNEFPMRSPHFIQKITVDAEQSNLNIIYKHTDILTTEQYNILIDNLPASTQVIKNQKLKDMRRQGVEQVSKMLKKRPSGNLTNNTISPDNRFAGIFGKTYKNYTPDNIVCVYDKLSKQQQIKKQDKLTIMKCIMARTELYKSKIISGQLKLITCKHENYTKEFHQLRAADEAAHRILTCVDCGRVFNIKS